MDGLALLSNFIYTKNTGYATTKQDNMKLINYLPLLYFLALSGPLFSCEVSRQDVLQIGQ